MKAKLVLVLAVALIAATAVVAVPAQAAGLNKIAKGTKTVVRLDY